MILYTPFYVGPHIDTPSLPPLEISREVLEELYKDFLIYGVAFSRAYDDNLTRVSPKPGVIYRDIE